MPCGHGQFQFFDYVIVTVSGCFWEDSKNRQKQWSDCDQRRGTNSSLRSFQQCAFERIKLHDFFFLFPQESNFLAYVDDWKGNIRYISNPASV
jgi:hypothetical protein